MLLDVAPWLHVGVSGRKKLLHAINKNTFFILFLSMESTKANLGEIKRTAKQNFKSSKRHDEDGRTDRYRRHL